MTPPVLEKAQISGFPSPHAQRGGEGLGVGGTGVRYQLSKIRKQTGILITDF
jgi:hypothetical protein